MKKQKIGDCLHTKPHVDEQTLTFYNITPGRQTSLLKILQLSVKPGTTQRLALSAVRLLHEHVLTGRSAGAKMSMRCDSMSRTTD